jgi:LysR family transcriptional regulator of beta-lactamase
MRAPLPLNGLRAFEAAARHQSFTRAALELYVSQAAVSHQIKLLEERLGVTLFRRHAKGVALTDEALVLAPALEEAFDRIAALLERVRSRDVQEVVTLGVVGTFAVGWLMPRLGDFRERCPRVDLRLLTNNNRVDLGGEGLDYAIRFGAGAWHGVRAERLFAAPLTPLCAPGLAARLATPEDLARQTLLRSYRADEWPAWFKRAGLAPLRTLNGPVFDSSQLMAQAAMHGEGVALAPRTMFEPELREERLVAPFALEVDLGAYWLTRLTSRRVTDGMQAFRDWLLEAAGALRPA